MKSLRKQLKSHLTWKIFNKNTSITYCWDKHRERESERESLGKNIATKQLGHNKQTTATPWSVNHAPYSLRTTQNNKKKNFQFLCKILFHKQKTPTVTLRECKHTGHDSKPRQYRTKDVLAELYCFFKSHFYCSQEILKKKKKKTKKK